MLDLSKDLQGKDTVEVLYCFDLVMSEDRCINIWREIISSARFLGYVVSDVNPETLGVDSEGNSIENKRRNKAILTFTKIKV